MNRPSTQLPRLVIVGRPNVGKSTLFNRLYGRRRALVHDEPGVTRDRLELQAEWWVQAKYFPVMLVDTGGLGGDKFANEIAKQVDVALQEADIVLVLFDGQAGYTPGDAEVVQQIKRSGLDKKVPIIGVVNKVDDNIHEPFINDFFQSSLDPIITVSAEHARGIEDLQILIKDLLKIEGQTLSQKDAAPRKGVKAAVLPPPASLGSEAVLEENDSTSRSDEDSESWEEESGDPFNEEKFSEQLAGELVEDLYDDSEQSEGTPEDYDAALDSEDGEYSEDGYLKRRVPRIAIVGRPNVGKSTLTNAILNEDRMITSEMAGTTIDAVDSPVRLNGKDFIFIDTAGIRRKSKTEQGVEVLSVVQARKALERCDLAILLMDGSGGVTDQDEKIGGLIEEVGCGVILAVNKWDTQKVNPKFTKELAARHVREQMAYLKYAPILFLSALNGVGYEDIGDLIDDILLQRRVKVPSREFTEWVRDESEIHNPGNAKFYFSHQSGRSPPTFVCHVSKPDKVHFSLRRHLVNAIRAKWGYMGSPVRMVFVEGKSNRVPPRRTHKRMKYQVTAARRVRDREKKK